MEMNTVNVKMIEKCSALIKRAEKVHEDFKKVRHETYVLTKDLDEHGSAIEKETMDDMLSFVYNTENCMEVIIHAMKRIAELCNLGKCDRYMVARVKMATCEVCAAEKEMEVLKEMLKIK